MIRDALALVAAAKECAAEGLMPGTSGNLSMRTPAGLLITPSGVSWPTMQPSDLAELDERGVPLRPRGPVPSSEWRLHCDVYRERPEVNAIVHTHSRAATVVSCLRQSLPAVHYMIAVSGRHEVRCADYATYGSAELGHNVVKALVGAKACLLANHGLVAVGATLAEAVKVAREIENVAALWLAAKQAGTPVLLDEAEISRVVEKLASYGRSG